MASRLILHEKLEEVLGSNKVYFQPPESLKLSYPCIVYSRSRIFSRKADDMLYHKMDRYTVTLIYKDPDSTLPHAIMDNLQLITHDRQFMSNNLIHDVYTLYF